MILLKELSAALREWARTQPRAVRVAAGLSILILGWLLFGAVIGQIRRLSAERTALRTELRESQESLARLRNEKTPMLSGVENAPEVLSRLEAMARTHDVRFLEISPGQPRSSSPDQPLTLPVEIRLEGGYRSLGEFLGALKKIERAGVLVRGVRISRDAQWLPRLRAQVSLELAFSPDGHGS